MRIKKPFYGWIIVAAAGIVILVMYGTLINFGFFFEPVLTEFNWSRATTAGAYSLATLIRGSLYVVAGRLTDKYGPRAVVAAGGVFPWRGYMLFAQGWVLWA